MENGGEGYKPSDLKEENGTCCLEKSSHKDCTWILKGDF